MVRYHELQPSVKNERYNGWNYQSGMVNSGNGYYGTQYLPGYQYVPGQRVFNSGTYVMNGVTSTENWTNYV